MLNSKTTHYNMIRCIFFMMKLHYIKLRENDVPDFFSVTFISFLFYSIFFTTIVIFVEIFETVFPSKYFIISSMLIILIGTSIIIYKHKKWHKEDAALELSKIPKRTKLLSYAFIIICFLLFIFSTLS